VLLEHDAMYMRTAAASACRSASRRAMYSRRSHVSGSTPGSSTRPCQIAGIVSRARSPSDSVSTGTLRQEATLIPCAASDSSATPGALESALGALSTKATDCRRVGLVLDRQKKSLLVVRALHPEEGLDAQRDAQVQPRLRVFEVEPGDLPDPVEAVAERVGMH